MLSSVVGRLRLVSLLEGVSFVVLLAIAMPLKYFADMPVAVRIAGMAHGVLFIAVCLLALYTCRVKRWGLSRAMDIIVAALLPLGPFFMDCKLKAAQAED